ncbi:hem peroxidase [Dillenia turbinata]|uniref:Peroxidase n=1 Tax=Dillenia turbinata TaxID=194707 RepID=A0AAN8ZHX7_9MAGN
MIFRRPLLPLQYEFYRQTYPTTEKIVWTLMPEIVSDHTDIPPALLRPFFHDCFIRACDGSVLLNYTSNPNSTAERNAIPNRTLRGFEYIDQIKEAVEKNCPGPGIVSCSDILAMATRDGIVLIGGPYYPVLTGRRDSITSYFNEATNHIPRPTDSVTQFLQAFGLRGFNTREAVALLACMCLIGGGHNIGRMGCGVIRARFNFSGTGKPDPSIPADLLNEMRRRCPDEDDGRSISVSPSPAPTSDSTTVLRITQRNGFMPNGENFDSHFSKNLLRGRGLIFSDQQLTQSPITVRIVGAYASDEGGSEAFRRDFAKPMVKLSNLNVVTGDDEGEIRLSCFMPRNT